MKAYRPVRLPNFYIRFVFINQIKYTYINKEKHTIE